MCPYMSFHWNLKYKSTFQTWHQEKKKKKKKKKKIVGMSNHHKFMKYPHFKFFRMMVTILENYHFQKMLDLFIKTKKQNMQIDIRNSN
jgi:hypothetical protein